LRQAAAARRLVYGTVKAGGLLNYAAQSSDGEYVHLSIILGEGKLQGVDPVFWISDEKSGSKAGQAHHSFVVTQPSGKRTRHIYHGSTKKVETMSPAPRSKDSSEQDLDDK
jgi:hypothetical protein